MEKIIVLIKSIYLTCYYYFLNLFSKNKIPLNVDNEFIVSLTTYHERIKSVFLVIESLINQSYMPSKIILWLSYSDIPDGKLPNSLVRLQRRGLIINFKKENIKSFKKLTHFCEDKENYIFKYVVTADDDVFYPKYWLFKFKEKNETEPGYVYCYRGKSIKFKEDGSIEDYQCWSVDSEICQSNSSLFMPTGVSGVCYPKEALTDDIFDRVGFLNNCKFADDIWYKCCVLKAGFGSKLVLNKNIHFIPVLFSLSKGLEVNNVQNGLNVVQLKNTLSYFNMTKFDFK